MCFAFTIIKLRDKILKAEKIDYFKLISLKKLFFKL